MILRALPIVLILLLQGAASEDEVGNIDGKLVIEQGRATYDLEMPYPKHFPALMEKISISYDSSADDGDAGFGWDIDGLSSITRCPQTIAQDKRIRGIQYDKEDRFCLDGQRLVEVEGKYGVDNTVYYTEVDSYRKITSHGKHGSGPASFTVRTKDNLILTYGTRAESQLIGKNQRSIHTWYLDTVRDYVGRVVKVDYLVTNRRPYVSKISYKKMAVEFRYKVRSDVSTAYFNGDILEVNDKLLDKVTAMYNGKEQSSLTLTHQVSGDAEISILTKYQFCGRENKCLKPVTMDYSGLHDVHDMDKPLHWIHDFSSISGWTSSSIRQLADVSGDGLDDIVGFKDDGVYVSINLNGTFDKPKRWDYHYGSGSGWTTTKHMRLIVDVNADGLLDILGFANEGVYASLNTGQQTFGEQKRLLNEFGYNQGWRLEKHPRFVTDLNADGYIDIVGLANDGVYISYGQGTSFTLPKLVFNDFGYNSPFAWRVEKHPRFLEDVTGDGLADLVGFHDGGVYVSINNGKGFDHKTQWISDFGAHRQWTVAKHERHLIDINGDALPDILGFSSTGVVVAINDGKKFLPAKKWVTAFGTEAGAWKDNTLPRYIADMNGDELPDIVGFGCCGVDVSLNTGSSFANPKKWSKHFDTPTWLDKDGPRMLRDVNGDGAADIVGFSHNGVYVSTNKNRRPTLVKIVDSFNNVDEIVYQSLGNSAIYTRDKTATYPTPSINSGQMVVWKILSSDGIGGMNVTRYHYGGLRIDLLGRGSLGFEEIMETEEGEGETVQKLYHQDFPLTGLEDSNMHTMDNVIVSNYEFVYETSMVFEGIQQVHLTKEMAHFRDLNDKIVQNMTRTFSEVDDYGNFGKVDVEVRGDGKTFKELIVNTYVAGDETNWYIDQLTTVISTKSDETGSSTTETQYIYDQTTRHMLKEIKEPKKNLGVLVEQTYDAQGNVVRMVQKPVHPKHLSNTTSIGRAVYKTYDDDGIYLLSTSNSLQHKESYQVDDFGNMVKITGANGLVTGREFDALGRPTEERRADGTKATWKYSWDNSLSNSRYKERKEESGKPTEVTIFDSFGRPIKSIVDGFKKKISEDTVYDKYGNVVKQSIPYFQDETNTGWITYRYDALGRDIETTKPISNDMFSTSKTEYDGFTTSKTNGLGHTTVTQHDVLGRVIKVTDALGGSMTYSYDPMDNLMKVTDILGHAITMKYDDFSNKVESNDPNMGMWAYGYDVYGQLVWQRDAKGQEITNKYDSLGRKVKMSDALSNSNWYYDEANHGLGKIGRVTNTKGFSRTFSYDNKGREASVSQTFDGETFRVRTAYNEFGRVKRQDYPGNKQVYFCYSNNGFMTKVKKSDCDGGTSGVYWHALEYDPHGQVAKERYDNGLETEYGYTLGAYTKHISTKNSVNGALIRAWDYEHDEGGNLANRVDSLGTKETFQYDALDRLVRSNLRKTDPAQQQVALTEDWEYDAIGNIRRYSGLGGLHHKYYKDKPHALKKAGPNTYSYDANGNLERKNKQYVSWTPFNKPEWLGAVGGGRVNFYYGPEQMRYKKVGPTDEKTVYVGKMYERVTKKVGVGEIQTHKYFIYALGRLIAVESKESTKAPVTAYFLTDHQGSIDTVTNAQGTVLQSMRYNAFGSRRRSDWDKFKTGLDLLQPGSDVTKRGYTGHEHIDELGLIHMNGRVYDPLVGRFLSADPLVQDPYDTQSFNRYSYTMNNPLKHNDPTGHFWKKIVRGVTKVFKRVVKNVGKFVKKVFKKVVNVVKDAGKAFINTVKKAWKELKPYIKPIIALGLRIGSKMVGTALAVIGGPIGIAAGIAVVAIGEYAASRVEGKSHKEAMKSGLISGALFGLGVAFGGAGSGNGFMATFKEKNPLAYELFQFGKDYGGYYKDVINFAEVYKKNGPPKTLMTIATVGSAGLLSKGIMNANDQYPTPFSTFNHYQGPVHGLLIDITRENLIGRLLS